MKLPLTIACFAAVVLPLGFAAPSEPPSEAFHPGDVVYRLERSALPTPRTATVSWVEDAPGTSPTLKVSAPPERTTASNVVSVPVDLRPWRGLELSLTCEARAEGVTVPAQPWLGIKCMLHFKSPSGERWLNANNLHGTFDWKTIRCGVSVPDDAGPGELVLGLQGSSGTAWLREVRLVVTRVPPRRPAPDPNAGPAYRGHTLPRLRGVMSPSQFREEDFAELERWHVNVVRWQLVRNWGKAGTDRDLAEYDQWISGKLDELEQVLASAQRHGLKIVIDLHSPPGGREEDRTLTMLLRQPYQDHFIVLWRQIATRFKGHPALWAYDLINEPVQNTPSPAGLADWLGIQVKAARAIRAIDPDTAIAIEVDGWDSPDAFRWLAPVDIPHVIYQVHMYQPGEYTHQGVNNHWGEQGREHLLAYPGTFRGEPFNAEWLRRRLAPVREFQLATHSAIYVGEFSAIRWAPGADRYLADLIGIFEEYGWDWTYHAFREWPGWSVEHADAPADPAHHVKASESTARARVLRSWFDRNVRPAP